MIPRNQTPCSPVSSYVITLTNISENETFCYSLPIIKGYVSVYSQDCNTNGDRTITLKRLDNDNTADEVTIWPVINGNFKCLANLNFGRNHFVLEFEDASLCLNLEFKTKTTNHHVLPVYIICDGHDGRFQAPDAEDNSPESACRRISLGSRLIQSLTAEKLHESDMNRRTFQLAYDMDIDMDCIVFHSKLRSEEVYEMEPEEIWENFGRELMSSPYGGDQRKFLAFLSCTRYISDEKEPATHDEVVARMQGHVALGGGGLAIFGTGCLHTWPETVEQVVSKFTDETKVDKTKFMDDSCYRGTYGSCFSTTLGSVCHELGHTFDLGHPKKGIMGRGFDNMNLVFTISNTQSKDANKNVISRNEAQHATVCFTRDLNVTYTMSSPIKRPRGRTFGIRHNSPQRRMSSESDVIKSWSPKAWPSDAHFDNERKQISYSKIPVDDLTFWERSCAVMLRYHRFVPIFDLPEVYKNKRYVKNFHDASRRS